jgi:hypothetical protein
VSAQPDGPLTCEGQHPDAPDTYKAVCTGDADFLVWPLAAWCQEGCPGHLMCSPCVVLSVARKNLARLTYIGPKRRATRDIR